MSRFKKTSHVLWLCKCYVVWIQEYRFRVLEGEIKQEVEYYIRSFGDQKGCSIEELNVQADHVRLLILVALKVSISELIGILKGRTAIKVFNRFKHLKTRLYWGDHFWSKGYCVGTVGLDSEMIKRYVKYREKKDKNNDKTNE